MTPDIMAITSDDWLQFADRHIQSLFLVVLTLLGIWRERKARSRDTEAKAQVASVASTVATTASTVATTASAVETIAVVGDQVHTLVNGGMGFVLKANAEMARQLAGILKTPESVKAAEEAEAKLAEHALKQARVETQTQIQLPTPS